ncbi:MAG: Holliday junction branch migration protein RuvA [Holosporales bacterium]|jgi:Holliday junction DNA helicase RuvA|nr:Holliday junction branch migration protein RuvA [Holosporales bacterium]
MIAKITGTIDEVFIDQVYVDVHGVCYGVLCSKRTIAGLQKNASVTMWIEHIIRAESQTLCGFMSRDEQLVFREITSVQGVGVKAGLAILSVLAPKDVVGAILTQDKRAFTAADGVGAKMAERLTVELKNSKVIKTFDVLVDEPSVVADAVGALVALGYEYGVAQRAISDALGAGAGAGSGAGGLEPSLSTEALVRSALVKLSTQSK